MTMRHLPGAHYYFSNLANHKHINETLKDAFDLRYDCSFMVGTITNPDYVFLRLNVGDDDYDLVGINGQDQIDTITLTPEFFDKYYSVFKRILRIDTLDAILEDLELIQEDS